MEKQEFGLEWGKPTIMMTKRGEREVVNAPATEEFWTAWRAGKEALKDRGYGVRKLDDGSWQVAFWKETMSAEARQEAHDASRATDAVINVPLPEGLELMPFQRAGVAYALQREGTLIGDEMGLGKTVQAIAVANVTGARRILVVAPASILRNWEGEIQKFQALGLPVTVIRPNGAGFNSRPGWFVINFDIVSRHDEELKREPWDLAVFDEVHRCKTRDALRTVVCFGGTKKRDGVMQKFEPIPAKRTLALTGTPILNRPAELYSVLHRLDPRRFPTWKTFANRYCWSGSDYSGARNLEELNARLRETVMVRRLKSEVLTELPAKRRQVVELEVETAEAQAAVDAENETYERTEEEVQAAQAAKLEAEAGDDKEAYEAAVARLRKARAVAFTEMSRVRHETAVAKIPAVLERLADVDGKALVFAHHHDVLDALCEGLAAEGVVRIDGRTPNDERQRIKDRFQEDPSVKWFVGGIIPAGVGLTLTAASQVYFAELDWVAKNIEQAEDRVHRIGQAESVNVYHLVFNGSLDSKMAKMMVEKARISDLALDKKVPGTEKPAPEKAPAEPNPPPLLDRYGINYDQIAVREEEAVRSSLGNGPERTNKPSPGLSPSQVAAIQQALRIVAGMDGDGARILNGVGFSKYDTDFGCSLAGRRSLTPKQAFAARKLVTKYKWQYPVELFDAMFGEGGEA
jgi:SWI/SNF-related matrix-associated actin-dependent regulator 1 of chromatin subfamily A